MVHSSFIQNSQQLETAQVSINRCVDKHTMVPRSHNGILHTEQKRNKQSTQAETFKNHKNMMNKKSFCKKKVQRV